MIQIQYYYTYSQLMVVAEVAVEPWIHQPINTVAMHTAIGTC